MLLLRGVAELSAERRHRDIECFGRAVPVLVPHLAHELISAHSRARVRSERREQIELLRSQCHLVIVEVAPSGCEVDGERAKLENRVRRWGNRATAKMRPEAGEQHGQAERFDEIIISARIEADDDIDLAAAGGKNDEQSFRIVAADARTRSTPSRSGRPRSSKTILGELSRTWMSAAAPVRHQAVG